jgi:hypothetical protein
MKRFALLSVVALMLASAVFAPVAMAQEPGDVNIQSVTLGPEGSLHVEGFIQCLEGHDYSIFLEARQTQGNQPVKLASGGTFDRCPSDGLVFFEADLQPAQGSKPIRKGEVTLTTFSSICGFLICEGRPVDTEVFVVR